MNWIKSRYKVTFGAAVILDFGELVDDDLKPSGTGLFSVVPLIRAAAPLIREGKNPSWQFGFSIQRRAPVDAPLDMDLNARKNMWDDMIAWQSGVIEECKIELDGLFDEWWKFKQAKITAYEPQVRPMEMGRTITRYSLVCAGLIKG